MQCGVLFESLFKQETFGKVVKVFGALFQPV